MQRRSSNASFPTELLSSRAIALLSSDLPIEEKLQHLELMRGACEPREFDRLIIEHVGHLSNGLQTAQQKQGELGDVLEKLTAPPFFPAIFLHMADVSEGRNAMVRLGSELRAVALGDGIYEEDLAVSDEVLLSNERNAIVGKPGEGCFEGGDLATFSRFLGSSRCVLKSRDEEFVAVTTRALRASDIRPGDEVRCDRAFAVAFEKVEHSRGDELFLAETPIESFDQIGGLDAQLGEIRQMFDLHFFHADLARKYQLKPQRSLLLYGPSGTGKTLIARAIANYVAKHSKHGRSRFANIAPGSLKSMWYGQTEQKIADVFRIAREASADGVPTILFFDEIDSIGSMRGESVNNINDHVLNSFMAQLSGLEDRGNVIVISATNLLSLLDTAVVRNGRLGDLVLKIPRPNRKAAREIFQRHMPETIPYACNGEGPAAARLTMIDSAVSRIFSANEDSELAQITFRDGKRRCVYARELINGAEIAAISTHAIQHACLRERRTGAAGVGLNDLLRGVEAFMSKSTRVLSPRNCRNYLEDLPQDVDVVRVDPAPNRLHYRLQYLNEVA